jgi:GTPase
MAETLKSGFVTIVGRPNVGKSTFLNTVLETKISITASKPQTTRDKILGIFDVEDAQIIFLDTPGIHTHTADKALNKYMVEKAISTISDADIALVMTEPADTPQTLSEVTVYLQGTGKDAILVLNKVDLMRREDVKAKLAVLGGTYDYKGLFPVSSLTGIGVPRLLDALKELLPEGPRYFPQDMITDATVRFLSQEIVREKVFTLTQREIPYATAVEVEEFREGEPTYIRAVIHVERPSQKKIVIGAGGKMLKEIGKEARIDIERLVGTKVFLELFVKVTKDWSKRPGSLKELGYK